MAEGEGEETTQRTTTMKTTTTKTTTTTMGIAHVWDAVTPTPRELVLSGRVRVNSIVEMRPNRPVRRNNNVIKVLRGSGGRTPPDDDDNDNAACWAGQGGFGPDLQLARGRGRRRSSASFVGERRRRQRIPRGVDEDGRQA